MAQVRQSLQVDSPAELDALCGMAGGAAVRYLELEVERWRPDPELAARFLGPENLPGLAALDLVSDAHVPSVVVAAIGRRSSLRQLSLTGRGVLDPQLEGLAAAEGLAGLQTLRLRGAYPVSAEGLAALARAAFVPTLKQLHLRSTLVGPGALAALAAGRWPRLQRLVLGCAEVDPAELADLRAALPHVQVVVQPDPWFTELYPAPLTQREFLAALAEQRGGFRLVDLAEQIDDERMLAELAQPAVLAPLLSRPAHELPPILLTEWRIERALARPYIGLFRSAWIEPALLAALASRGIALPIEHLELWLEKHFLLRHVLPAVCPRLVSLDLYGNPWQLDGVDLPPTLRRLRFRSVYIDKTSGLSFYHHHHDSYPDLQIGDAEDWYDDEWLRWYRNGME